MTRKQWIEDATEKLGQARVLLARALWAAREVDETDIDGPSIDDSCSYIDEADDNLKAALAAVGIGEDA